LTMRPLIISTGKRRLSARYTHQSTWFRMRVQFIAAVILGLMLSPAPVFGCTCAAPPPEVKTASELAAWTRTDAGVLHSYRGDQRKPMRLSTGLGGGDCGFDFEVGKQYLVYAFEDAFKDETGELSTNICIGTTRLEKSSENLAYPRGKRVAPATNKEASTRTSNLCGRVIPVDATGSSDSLVLLVRLGSKSRVQPIFGVNYELAAWR